MKETMHNTVHELRSARGMTQEEVAEALGVSRQTVIAIEKGNYTPSVALALKIGALFATPIEKIFTLRHEK